MQLTNVARLPVSLYFGMKIGQLSFHRLSTPAERLYGDDGLGSKYQGQVDPTASRFHLNFEG
jgi:dCTP deaminase